MEVNSRLIISELSLRKISATTTHAWTKCPVNTVEWTTVKTRDPGSLLYMGLKTKETKSGTWDLYDRWDPRPKTNLSWTISYQTWDAKTMIQMDLIKCPKNRIWIIIFLIFNHITKRQQHLQQISSFSVVKSWIYIYVK